MTNVQWLSPILKSMRGASITRQRFQYRHRRGAGAVVFNVFFIVDTMPYHLLFGTHAVGAATPFALLFKVHPDLTCDGILAGEEYKELCRLLGLKYDPDRPFSPATFLAQLGESGQVPGEAMAEAIPRYDEIPLPSRHVSDAEKPYFSHWLDNNRTGNRVSGKNLSRTALAFGQKWADFCANNNISTCWAADRGRERPIPAPPGMNAE